MFKKVCKECKTEFQYEKAEELKPHFYFKNGYYLNTCITCEKQKHAKKYAEGSYNYFKKKMDNYAREYTVSSVSGKVRPCLKKRKR